MTRNKRIVSTFCVLVAYAIVLLLGILPTYAKAFAEQTAVQHWVETSYENIFKDAQLNDGARLEIDILAAINEYESEQVVLKHTTDFDIMGIEFSDLVAQNQTKVIDKSNLTYNYVGFVKMNNSEGQNANTVVRWTGKTSTSANSADMQWFPDRLYNRKSISVKANEAQPIYINVFIPKNAAAAAYTSTAKIATSVGEISVPISVKVANVAIADSEDAAYTQAYWQQLANTWKKDVYGLGVLYQHEKYSDKWWELMANVADGLKATRMNSLAVYPLQLLLDGKDTKLENGVYTFDFSKFDEFISFFMDRGAVKYLEGNALLGTTYATSTWGFILDNNSDGSGMYLRKVDKLYPNYVAVSGDVAASAGQMDADCDKFYKQYLKALNSHLIEKGWKDRWIQHIEDEAGSEREQIEYSDFVVNYFKPMVSNVRYGDPMDHNYADWFIENTSFLFPLTTQFDANKAKYEKAINNGSEVWMYSCLNPQGANLNKFIDKNVWQVRSMAWLSYMYGVTGHLQWSYNGWWTNAADGAIFVDQDNVNVQRFRFKGDDFYVYPDIENNTFEQSIRSISSRDSSEEYELLSIVGSRDAEHKAWTNALISEIVTSNSKYSKDTALMAANRAKLIKVAAGELLIDEAVEPEQADDMPLHEQVAVANPTSKAAFNGDLTVNGDYTITQTGTGISFSDIGKKDMAVEFSGDADTFLNLQNSSGTMFNPSTSSFTISAWLYQTTRTAEPVIVGQTGGNGRTWLYLNTSNKICSFFGGAEGNFETDYVLPLKQWTHVAVVVENVSAGNGNAVTYVNGAPMKVGTVKIDSSTDKLIIGRHKNAAPVKAFCGKIDDLNVYDYALTPQQLYTCYYYDYPPMYDKVENLAFSTGRGGSTPSLPSKVKVTLDNGMTKYLEVNWNGAFVPGDLESAGTKSRTGTFLYNEDSYQVTASLTVFEKVGVNENIVTTVGLKPELPACVTVTDGETQIKSRVVWSYAAEDKYSVEGSYTVSGYLPEISGVAVLQKVIVKAIGDKALLQSAVSEADAKVKEHYTKNSFDVYTNMIDEANVVLADYRPYAETVNKAISNIAKAEKELVDIKDLNDLYAANKDKTQAAYSEDSFNAFKIKLDSAKAVLDNVAATNEQVILAKQQLMAAVNALVAAVEKPEEKPEEKPTDDNVVAKKGCNANATNIAILAAAMIGAALIITKIKKSYEKL